METKTIVLKEFEGKRDELHLFEEENECTIFVCLNALNKREMLYYGSVPDFLSLPNKEEIAEKVVENILPLGYVNYEDPTNSYYHNPLESLLSAIGDYKYFILTETEI